MVSPRLALRLTLSSACVLCLPSACLRPAADRAERDQELGRGNTDGIELEVADGLAIVRDMNQERIRLWQSAPALDLTLSVSGDSPRTIELFIENCLPSSRLLGSDGVESTLRETPYPTECAWNLGLPSGVHQLHIGQDDADTPETFRIAVLSDVQEALFKVGDIFQRINQEPDLAFLLGAGDLTQDGDREQLEHYQAALKQLDIPYYTTLGNHELGHSPTLFQDYFGRVSFHFWFHQVAFTLIDSASATLDPIVYDWLQDWLSDGQNAVHIVAMHIPPLDPVGIRNGAFASRAEAGLLLGKLAAGAVDLTLYGHIHTYLRFQNAGIEAHISGGGGAVPQKFDGIGRHFLVVDIDPRRGVLGTRIIEVGG